MKFTRTEDRQLVSPESYSPCFDIFLIKKREEEKLGFHTKPDCKQRSDMVTSSTTYFTVNYNEKGWENL